MKKENAETVWGISILAITFVIGGLAGFSIGNSCGINSVREKYNKYCKACADDYRDMRASYFLLKEHLLKRAKEKGVEL